jgi:beta-phosphoglucomutase family hydrolase
MLLHDLRDIGTAEKNLVKSTGVDKYQHILFLCTTMKESLLVKSNLKKENEMNLKGVIFDMDGTLIETTEADYLAWKRVFADYHKQLAFEDYFPLIGMKSAMVVKTRLSVDEEETKKALAQKMKYFSEIVSEKGIQIVPYAIKFLKQLKEAHLKIALATSSRQKKMELVLQLTNLTPYFDIIVNGDLVHKSKPAPDIFLKAAEKLQLKPEECVVIEDAANGVKAAKNAGMKCVAITTTHTEELLKQADIVIDSYEHLDLQKIYLGLKNN